MPWTGKDWNPTTVFNIWWTTNMEIGKLDGHTNFVPSRSTFYLMAHT